ncbi:MAG: tetratricopeptide repeat protein [Balneolaceae bacterium]|nr:tetratricopeptide repeat protein [Balneolaceae bacterium]
MPENRNIRLLAAIMFADMVGYTKLMQQDEALAKELRDRQRKVVDNYIAEHRGQVMQYYGDGTLSMFGSAIEAVNAARSIQLELQKDPEVPLRIGIHLGDVVYDDEGIFGDAVNLAARVQGLGIPGSVMMSGKVFEEIKNHPGIRVEAFGEHELKNVFQTTGIFALANDGIKVPEQRHIQEITGSYQNSVAVLPFANFSGDPADEYFSDGITEEIINALVKVGDLSVTSRTSVFAYKNTSKDIRQIAKELNVAAILEGSVRKAGDRIRVTAQLINADDGFHIWSENFDGEMKDIFGVQDEIAKKIAEKLVADSFFDSSGKLYEASTDSVVAYNHYLEGLYHWNKRTPESVRKAITVFEHAINYCTTYTNAYSALANCYSFLGAIGHLPANEAYKQAEEYAIKSVELNSTRAESYAALGLVNLFSKWNFEVAEANLRKAITLEPEYLDARIGLGYLYRATSEFDRMIHHNKAACQIDPLSLPAKLELARAYVLLGDYENSEALFHEILELDPLFRAAFEGISMIYLEKGDFDNALKYARKYLKLVKEPNTGGAFLGYIAAIQGDMEGAIKNIEKIKKRSEEKPHLDLSLDFACVYAGMGDADTAFNYINEGIDKGLGAMIFFDSMIPFKNLVSDPRYQQVRERIGLPTLKMMNA